MRHPITAENHGGALAKLFVFLVIVFAFVAVAWMLFLPTLVTHQLRERSGFDASITRLAVNPFTGSVELHGFVLANPPTFPESDFLDIREFRANGSVRSLLSNHPVFEDMLVDVASVTLVKRSDGTTNADAFSRNLEAHDGSNLVPKTPSNRNFLIRHLEVRVEKLIIADYSLRQPGHREFSLHLDQTYKDVTAIDQLLAPSALKNLAPVAAAISGLLPGDLGKVFGQAAGSSKDLFREAGERVKGFFDALEESKKP